MKDDSASAQRIIVGVLDGVLRLVHPVMPFVTESIWQALNESAFERGLPSPAESTDSVMIAAWPTFPESWQDDAVEGRIARMQELIRSVREIRNNFMVDDKTTVAVAVKCSADLAAEFNELRPFITQLATIGELTCGPDVAKPPQAASKVAGNFALYVSLAGLIDPVKERARLEKQLAEKQKLMQGKEGKLANEGFVARAPAEVVQQERDAIGELRLQIEALRENLNDLAG